MTKEEIRQKAIDSENAFYAMCLNTTCKECEYHNIGHITLCPAMYGYEHGFADGVEEGKKLAVKHGKWIEREVPISDDDADIVYKCSCCGNEDGMNHKSMKYCPDCGAKMDEEGEQT